MAFWFNCPEHGRFPITATEPDMTQDRAFELARVALTTACPKCGVVCDACKCRGAVIDTGTDSPRAARPTGRTMTPAEFRAMVKGKLDARRLQS